MEKTVLIIIPIIIEVRCSRHQESEAGGYKWGPSAFLIRVLTEQVFVV